MQTFSDFISKSFDFNHSVKTVHKASGGVKIENGSSTSGNGLKSYTKVNFPAANGKSEVRVTVNGADKDTNAKFEAPSFNGVDLTVSATCEPKVTVEANCSPVANVGTKLELVTDLADKKALNLSVNASSNGVKATVDTNLCLGGGGLKDYNFKLDYKQDKLLATVKTADQRSKFTASVAQQFCAGFYWGAQATHTLKDGSTKFCVGSTYKLDDTTSGRLMADCSGTISAAVEHKLSNPACKVNAAAQFKFPFTAEKYGLGMTFGDY